MLPQDEDQVLQTAWLGHRWAQGLLHQKFKGCLKYVEFWLLDVPHPPCKESDSGRGSEWKGARPIPSSNGHATRQNTSTVLRYWEKAKGVSRHAPASSRLWELVWSVPSCQEAWWRSLQPSDVRHPSFYVGAICFENHQITVVEHKIEPKNRKRNRVVSTM